MRDIKGLERFIQKGLMVMLKKWEDLPGFMQKEEVRSYYLALEKRKVSLFAKRLFDVLLSVFLLVILAIPMIVIGVVIKLDSRGPVFYRQERVTQYGKLFRIHKFRTMVNNADRIGTAVTVKNDSRITRVGSVIRKIRLDEIPQLIDVLKGDMSFVGTRPEDPKYVRCYSDEMIATLLLPAGVTSETSIRYKDEAEILEGVEDVDSVYVEKVLPAKMEYNLKSVREFSILKDFVTIIRTAGIVFGKSYE